MLIMRVWSGRKPGVLVSRTKAGVVWDSRGSSRSNETSEGKLVSER